MTRDLVECILASSSEQIEHLELNNLLQWSEIVPPLPKFANFQDIYQYWKEHRGDHEALQDTRIMAGALDFYLGRCHLLTSLCIATVGNGDHWRRVSDWDDRRYRSWADFLDLVRNNVCYLSFKQGVNRNEYAALRGSRPGRSRCTYRDMDHRFRQWIMPVLLNAPWPKVKRMEIKGVGRSWETRYSQKLPTEAELAEPGVKYQVEKSRNFSRSSEYEIEINRPAFPYAVRDELRGLLPEGAELVVQEEQERDYEYLSDDDNGIIELPVDV